MGGTFSTVTSKQEGSNPAAGRGPFCLEFACSLCMYGTSLWFSLTGSFNLTGDFKLALVVNVSVNGCRSLCVNPVKDL